MSGNYVSASVYWSLYHKHKALEEENAILRKYISNKQGIQETQDKTYGIERVSAKIRIDSSNKCEYINTEKRKNERCHHIKKNGERCKQRGDPKQSGGEIIRGRCEYHR